MQAQQNIKVTKTEGDLSILNYTEDATHPSDASFYRGVVVDDSNNIVARSFQWSPTEIVEADELPTGLVYTKFREGTIVCFYRHGGKPMICTRKQVNIANKKSQIPGSNVTFIQAIKSAISDIPYSEEEYLINNQNNESLKGIVVPPKTWEDLCIDGFCHVFILIDHSNQLTDLEGQFEKPKLVHLLSYYSDVAISTMVPFHGPIKRVLDTPDQDGNVEYTYKVDVAEVYDYNSAQAFINEGGAVVGFDPSTPDITMKFFSTTYATKLDLVGESFNTVHRWHQLMDEDSKKAELYLSIRPIDWKHGPSHQTQEEMMQINASYNNETADFLTENIMMRINKKSASLDPTLYNFVIDHKGSEPVKISHLLFEMQGYVQKQKNVQNIRDKVKERILNRLKTLSYTDQHALHGKVSKNKSAIEKGLTTY